MASPSRAGRGRWHRRGLASRTPRPGCCADGGALPDHPARSPPRPSSCEGLRVTWAGVVGVRRACRPAPIGRAVLALARPAGRETLVTSGTMTNRVDRLAARGLVEREITPTIAAECWFGSPTPAAPTSMRPWRTCWPPSGRSSPPSRSPDQDQLVEIPAAPVEVIRVSSADHPSARHRASGTAYGPALAVGAQRDAQVDRRRSLAARKAQVGPEPDTSAPTAPYSSPASSTWRSRGCRSSAAG